MRSSRAKKSPLGWVPSDAITALDFIDLRDRYGVTQLVFDPDFRQFHFQGECRTLASEFVISLKAWFAAGGIDGEPKLAPRNRSGVTELHILSAAKTSFVLDEHTDAAKCCA